MSNEPKLLVVDDEEVICEGCRRIFTRQGFEVEKCSDACQGLRLASEHDYSAILLDIKMPEMDGIAFLEALRKEKPTVPVVLMTGYPSVSNAASAMRLGASDYVTKPFTPEEISQAVHRLLHSERPTEQTAPAEATSSTAEGLRYWHDAWYQAAADGAVRTGAVLRATRGQDGRTHHAAADRRSGLSGPAAGGGQDRRLRRVYRARAAIRRGRVGKRGPDGRSLAVVDFPLRSRLDRRHQSHAPGRRGRQLPTAACDALESAGRLGPGTGRGGLPDSRAWHAGSWRPLLPRRMGIDAGDPASTAGEVDNSEGSSIRASFADTTTPDGARARYTRRSRRS